MTEATDAVAGEAPVLAAPTDDLRSAGVDLSICIPYYGEIDYLRHCLTTLPYAMSRLRFEVVVVDDGSPEPCAQRIAEEFPDVRVIVNAENRGFAGAINRAVRASTAKYLLLLNSDTKVLDGLAEAITFLEKNTDVGAAGPRVLNPDGSLQRQCRRGRLTPASAFGYCTGLDRLYPTGQLGEYLERWRPEEEQQDVAALSGACMFVRREVFESLGGLDEKFIMYGEDLDLCYRIGEAGFRLVYFPRANVIHAGGRGGSRERFFRCRLLFWRAMLLVLMRDRRTRESLVYRWLLPVAASLGFLGSCLLRRFRIPGVGGQKSASDLPLEDWPGVDPRLSLRASAAGLRSSAVEPATSRPCRSEPTAAS